ncbi:MAG: DNA-binding response regulator [Flavobacteriaceae bacterium]|nr:MAG: DNA-binding response regulator [Flavobacteriaceae bacterium]
MNIKCIIIDDEPLACTVIACYLKDISNIELVGTFGNAIDAISLLEEGGIDLIFLDINLPKMSGLEFLKTWKVKPLVVITTAYREYAVDSFSLDVLDYLVKPIPLARFLKSINKVSTALMNSRNVQVEVPSSPRTHIFLKVEKKLVKFRLNELLFIESLKDYVKVTTLLGDYLVHRSMTSILEELPNDQFIRVHRSFAISLNKVNCIEGNTIEISNKRIPIGRNYQVLTKQRILDVSTFEV